jgi:hypothetical protein
VNEVMPIGRSIPVAALITVYTALPAQNYTLSGLDWKNVTNPMGEPFQICTTGMPANSSAIIKQAAATWNYSKFKFSFSADGCNSGGVYPSENDVDQIDLGAGLPANTLARMSRFYKKTTGKIYECDLRFNSTQPWYVGTGTPGPDQFDMLSVALHEFGHCLGLSHSDVAGAVMTRSISFGETKRSLQPDDLNGRRAIYGAP